MPELARKPGAAKDATLNHALGAESGRGALAAADVRAAALGTFERLELPVWRRSGFWTTSLKALDLDALSERSATAVPDVVAAALGDEALAGVIVQSGSSTVRCELDPELASRGVVLCPLDEAPEALVAEHLHRRVGAGRDKLEAASAAFWRAGAFLHVPRGLRVERPFQVVYAIEEPGTAQYAHTLIVGAEGSDFRVRHYELAPDFEGVALHAGQFELYLADGARCRLGQLQDWGAGDVHDVSTHVVDVGRDAYVHWLPSYLGGALTREHLELVVSGQGGDMAFRGLFFGERDELLDLFAVDRHETGPSSGDVHWAGAATGTAKVSFEGLIQIEPGAQQTHTYLQIHQMMLSPRAKIDAIPSVLVSADDVSASHGGTVGELDEALIFYMRTRGMTRAQAVKQIVGGFFEPLVGQLSDEALEALVRERIEGKLADASADIEVYASAR